jgi:hypothetical protein
MAYKDLEKIAHPYEKNFVCGYDKDIDSFMIGFETKKGWFNLFVLSITKFYKNIGIFCFGGKDSYRCLFHISHEKKHATINLSFLFSHTFRFLKWDNKWHYAGRESQTIEYDNEQELKEPGIYFRIDKTYSRNYGKEVCLDPFVKPLKEYKDLMWVPNSRLA